MFANLKLFLLFPILFLLLYGTMPVAVSALYGGSPPEHVARLLDKQMDTFSEVARGFFGPFLREDSRSKRE